MSHLFEPWKLRDVELRNRIGVSPMCQYSCKDGFADDWHLVHLGTRAVGGAGLVIMEASAVTPEGRISDGDHGIWSDAHIAPLRKITSFIKSQGAAAGIQLAHAGRKASKAVPWLGDRDLTEAEGRWTTLAPSALSFGAGHQVPKAMSKDDIAQTVAAFADAAKRALASGFNVLELHGAHGYLLHSFLSPLANQRSDEYGGTFANRTRLMVEVVRAVRKVWPERLPLLVRFSYTDWVDGGWNLEESVALARILKTEAVDLIDCSSGGLVPNAKYPVGANYQVHGAETIRREAGVPTAAVGMITQAMQADAIVRSGQADLVFLAREMLRDPYWPLHAAPELHVHGDLPVPKQYARAFPALRK